MNTEEFSFSNKSILLEKREELGSSYKIKSYKKSIKLMEEKKIPQKEIKEALDVLSEYPESDIYLSMEKNMSCGLGKCGHCMMGKYYVCKDGPVFTYEEIKNEPDIWL